MRGAAIALAVVVVSCVAATDAAAGEKCVSIKKKTKVYAKAATDAPVGSATKKAVGYVEKTEGAWHVVRFERVVEAWGISGKLDGDYSRDTSVRVHVRKRDVRKARCPQGPTVHMMMDADAGTDLYWPDGTAAGWSYSGLSGKALRASTDELTAADKTLRCIDYAELPGLKLRLCADPADQIGDLGELGE